jgi:PPOX class probable F420-dependent enzyme
MELSHALEFIKEHHRAVLATTRRDGSPQLSLVAAGVEGDSVVISTRETARKTKNLQRSPRASLLVFTDAFYGDWVQVDGPVEIVHLPEAMVGLVAYYRQVAGEHRDWDEYRAADSLRTSSLRCELPVAASVAHERRPGVCDDLEPIDSSSHQHLEPELFRSSEVTTESVTSTADDWSELAVHRFNLLERVDGVGAGENPGESLFTCLEDMDDEAAALEDCLN